MRFATPQLLWGLALLPLLALAFVLSRRRRPRFPIQFTNLDVLTSVMPRPSPWRLVPPALFVLALAALIVGAARPQALARLPREEATVVLTLDVSASMRDEDVSPNRIEAAKRAALRFVDGLPPRFQVGLVAFNHAVDVLSHPTTDRVAVKRAIGSLEATGSTAIGDALLRSLRLDPEQRWRYIRSDAPMSDGPPLEAVVLLSDGRQTAGKVAPLDASRRAEELGLPVFTIALGPPPSTDPDLMVGGADHETLQEIARQTGGQYYSAPSSADLNAIYSRIGSRLGFVKEYQELTFAFAGGGLLLALLATGAGARRSWRFP